ncbi:zf-PARP-domain-containing protein [Dothidotthia symphoricarpi CBS 119687]|uniref:Zf-PARP-domain-containing protein n=1 Tax=Dothidotthia symphoricarpi CBS 119687 TaxID=1392245 RepID=A0A6A6ANX5_9PLEO|nr:zf-PARP-domain-containing protein [Dothidotthia symphoricarpi CBS 119687]KAF2133702.1 zf-PARP-domain-containing protein [Dothidotthia symphoricarpi CBS 119687]
MEGYTGEGPKWRLEHAANNRSTCQQAVCKRGKVKIGKGELRIGTHTLFDNEDRHDWYMAWRHWACATKHQLKGLKDTTDNDATKAPGYHSLSPESQEQIRLAFENDCVTDKEFKGISEDMAKRAPKYGGEILNATGYKVDVARRAAGCRGSVCQTTGVKILKGELRLGISIPYDGEHESWVYKHWKCMSEHDLEAAKEVSEQDSFDGIDDLPAEYNQVVLETFEKGEVVEPPAPEVEPPKTRRKKKKAQADDNDGPEVVTTPTLEPKVEPQEGSATNIKAESDELDDVKAVLSPQPDQEAKPKKPQGKKRKIQDKDTDAPKPKRNRKKKAVKEVETNEESEASEVEYVPRKTRSRRVPLVEAEQLV